MFNIRKDFNCCKTVGCKNFGINESSDYVYKSKRFGYVSVQCKACGSNPPWINNPLIEEILKEKLSFHFARKISYCRNCSDYFFFNDKNSVRLHGFTAAGTQRLKCKKCQHVYSLSKHKNITALTQILQTIIDNLDINQAIKKTALPARLYYFYLDKLAQLFSNYSRLKEQAIMEQNYIALQTEGKVLHLDHQRGFYTLLTSDAKSGYILLQTNNLTEKKLAPQDSYQSPDNAVIKDHHAKTIENELEYHYQQTMQRKHFEKLLVGTLKPVRHCDLIYPAQLAYVHFSLLRAFTKKTQRYGHYIELESSLRAAALMSSFPEVITKNADVYYYFPFSNNQDKLVNKKVGWWNDRWFSFALGAYCPITSSEHNNDPFQLADINHLNRYYSYLDKHLNKSLNSFNSIAHFSEIHRVLFNFCQTHQEQSAAMVFTLASKPFSAMELLQEAINLSDNIVL